MLEPELALAHGTTTATPAQYCQTSQKNCTNSHEEIGALKIPVAQDQIGGEAANIKKPHQRKRIRRRKRSKTAKQILSGMGMANLGTTCNQMVNVCNAEVQPAHVPFYGGNSADATFKVIPDRTLLQVNLPVEN